MGVLERLVDDAGLFPPSSLPMAEAVARHRATSNPMLTGRFLVPGARLDELSALLDGPLEVHIIGPGSTTDPRVRVVALEGVEAAPPSEVTCYVEGTPPDQLAGAYGKVRCSGISDEALASYVHDAVRTATPFKATAGLHRAVRGWDGPGFHGYLNLLLAVARALDGQDPLPAICEDDPEVLVRDLRALDPQQGQGVRALLHSYGSCDTTQPYLDAQELGLVR